VARFGTTSSPQDFHLQATAHAGRTARNARRSGRSLSLGQGMLRFINRPHGKETLGKTTCAAFLISACRRVSGKRLDA